MTALLVDAHGGANDAKGRPCLIALLPSPSCPAWSQPSGRIVFAEASDYRYYLDTLWRWKRHFDVKVYAYVRRALSRAVV